SVAWQHRFARLATWLLRARDPRRARPGPCPRVHPRQSCAMGVRRGESTRAAGCGGARFLGRAALAGSRAGVARHAPTWLPDPVARQEHASLVSCLGSSEETRDALLRIRI